MTRMNLLVFLFFVAGYPSSVLSSNHSAESIRPDITADELRQHVRYLASKELEGRLPGTPGDELAAQYLSDEFGRYGLQPMGDNGTYFQSFPFLSGIEIGKRNNFSVSIGGTTWNFESSSDFTPLAFTADTTVTGNVVFVGYGIDSDSLSFNEYASVDVKGKIVMVLRFTPDYGKHDSKFDSYAPLYRKAFIAREKGAAGMILVTGPADDEPAAKLIPLRVERDSRTVGIAALNLRSDLADSILRWAGVEKDLKALQQTIYDSLVPISFPIPNVIVNMETDVEPIYKHTANVIGRIPGNDPALRDEAIIVGAHFDHLGWGGEGTTSRQRDTAGIHHGADDNASGTAAMLGIARYLSANPTALRRTHIFTGFSAEEMGLLGSAFYTNNPPHPLDQTVAMLNLDMVGRMRDSSLNIQGIGTSPVWREIVDGVNQRYGFTLRLGEDGFGPSDHASFYAKNIPVLFFFTGLHEDYHRPTDTWDKINYPALASITRYAADAVVALDSLPRPAFTRVQVASARRGGMGTTRVTLGVVPDFADHPDGLRITGTSAGSPAQKAGLQNGDVIVSMAGRQIKNIYDLTYLLQEQKPGDEVEIVYRRDGETRNVKVVLEARR